MRSFTENVCFPRTTIPGNPERMKVQATLGRGSGGTNVAHKYILSHPNGEEINQYPNVHVHALPADTCPELLPQN